MAFVSTAGTPSAVRAVLWILAAALLFTGGGMVVKMLGQKLPASEIALFRALAGLALVAVIWREFGKLREPRVNILRGVFGAAGIIAYVYALASGLPMALVLSIYYTRVVITMAMASVFLGERVKCLLGALTVCVVGAGIALYPGLPANFDLWAALGAVLDGSATDEARKGVGLLAALVAALCSSVSQVCIRRLAQSNPPSLIVAVFGLLCAVIIVGPAAAVWVTPPVADLPFLAGVGAFAIAAQYAVARANRLMTASSLALFNFIEIPFGAVIDLVVFATPPAAATAVGAVLIVAASAYVIRINSRN